MKCPIDNVDLVMTERHGIEVDYCPTCRGVWLDRGELDKIIDRAVPATPPAQAAQPVPESYRPRDDYRRDERPRDEYRGDRNDPYYKKKRKESFLGDLFDF